MSIEAIAVVIPARNEEALISSCLQSVHTAIAALASLVPLTVQVIVVLDGCSDDTAARVASFSGVDVVVVDAGSVGMARAAGVASALAASDAPRENLWIANTDADSVVPTNWLIEQVRLADAGADAVVGTVSPDMRDLTKALVDAWHLVRQRRNPAGHVHGANLGLRSSSYLAVGGFGSERIHEDVGLVERLISTSAAVHSSLDIDVLTSGRKANRVSGGYAAYLHGGTLRDAALSQELTA